MSKDHCLVRYFLSKKDLDWRNHWIEINLQHLSTLWVLGSSSMDTSVASIRVQRTEDIEKREWMEWTCWINIWHETRRCCTKSTKYRKDLSAFLGGGFKHFYFHPYLGDDPLWLILFRWVETTNQFLIFGICWLPDSQTFQKRYFHPAFLKGHRQASTHGDTQETFKIDRNDVLEMFIKGNFCQLI